MWRVGFLVPLAPQPGAAGSHTCGRGRRRPRSVPPQSATPRVQPWVTVCLRLLRFPPLWRRLLTDLLDRQGALRRQGYNRSPVPTVDPQESMISQSGEPLVTVAPTWALRFFTVPLRWAVSGCSIFIASRTTTRSPASTMSPSATATFTMVPCMGEVSALPEGVFFAAALWRLTGFFDRAAVVDPLAAPRSAGTSTSNRLPLTSTTTLERGSDSGASPSTPAYGAICPLNSVSIQRVCTPKCPSSAV